MGSDRDLGLSKNLDAFGSESPVEFFSALDAFAVRKLGVLTTSVR